MHRDYKNKALLLRINKHSHIFYKGSTGSTPQRVLIWYTNSIFMLTDILILSFCRVLAWGDGIWGLGNAICVVVFPVGFVLQYSCVIIDYFYPLLSYSAAFPFVPARLSGSRTAPRGSHVWLSQSRLRATQRGGGADCVCVKENVMLDQSCISVSLFLIFWLGKTMYISRVRLL